MDERIRVLIFSLIREIFLTILRWSMEIKTAIRIFVFYAQPCFFFFFLRENLFFPYFRR